MHDLEQYAPVLDLRSPEALLSIVKMYEELREDLFDFYTQILSQGQNFQGQVEVAVSFSDQGLIFYAIQQSSFNPFNPKKRPGDDFAYQLTDPPRDIQHDYTWEQISKMLVSFKIRNALLRKNRIGMFKSLVSMTGKDGSRAMVQVKMKLGSFNV